MFRQLFQTSWPTSANGFLKRDQPGPLTVRYNFELDLVKLQDCATSMTIYAKLCNFAWKKKACAQFESPENELEIIQQKNEKSLSSVSK